MDCNTGISLNFDLGVFFQKGGHPQCVGPTRVSPALSLIQSSVKGHTIYEQNLLLLKPSVPVLCDLGQARFRSEPYEGDALPDLYRAPEILLRLEWDEKIDIWALGLVVSHPENT